MTTWVCLKRRSQVNGFVRFENSDMCFLACLARFREAADSDVLDGALDAYEA
ncbi:MAG: hypothetical protein ABJN96_13190 [Marinomonas sp.]